MHSKSIRIGRSRFSPGERPDFRGEARTGKTCIPTASPENHIILQTLLHPGKVFMRHLTLPLVLLFCTAPVRANDTAGSAGMATVERRPFVKFVTLTGELEASDSLIVYAPRIPHHWNLKLSHLADQGSAVRKGELLVKFDGSSLETERLDLEKKREEARLKIARKEAEIGSQRQEQLLQQATAEKELKVARIYADIPPDLIPHEDSEKYRYDVSQAGIKLDKAEQQLASQKETGRAELEVLQLDYQRADLQLNQLLQAIDRLTVRAPTPGLAIRARHLREQRRIQAGDPVRGGRPVMMLPNLDRLEVAAVVYDSELGLLQEGLPAEVVLDAYPSRRFRGRVLQVSEAAKSRSWRSRLKVFEARVSLLETDLAIMKPGMTARVRIPVPVGERLTAPREALHLGPDGEVYARDETGRRLPVQVLDTTEQWVAVAGLDAGQKLLLNSDSDPNRQSEGNWIRMEREDFTLTVPGNGVLKAALATLIRSPALPNTWRYKITYLAPEGSPVEKGDVVVRLDPTEVEKKLREESANLEKAQEEYEKTKASLELSGRDLDLELEEARADAQKKEKQLVEAREFQSILDVRKAEYEAELARRKVETLELQRTFVKQDADLQLKILQDSRRLYEERASHHRRSIQAMEIASPRAGTVLYERNWRNEPVRVGSDVYMGNTILSLPDLSSLVVDARVAEIDAGKVRVGQEVRVDLDAIPDRTFKGRIASVATLFSPASFDRPMKVLDLTVELERVDQERMRPGMASRIRIVVNHFQDVLTLPLSVIQTENGESFVWVKQDGRPVRRSIRLGRDNGVVAVVQEGLSEGEEVANVPDAG